tara:strand:- start:350 stop:529 length:180 start_codon:yes stop_codon:yes gene_type:complete
MTTTIYIYDQKTDKYLDQIFLTNLIKKNDVFDFIKINKEEIETNIKEYYNLNKIYYSIV